MNATTSWKVLATAVALASTAAGCGDVVRQGRAPVFLVIERLEAQRGAANPTTYSNTLLSDVSSSVTSPPPCTDTAPCLTTYNDMGRVSLTVIAKDVSAAPSSQPTTNNYVTVTRYHVSYRRADGRNTPGVDVPYGFDGAATATVPANGSAQIGFEIVRHIAKGEAPLVQLKANPAVISTIADVTFYGRDLVGNEVNVTGSMLIDFGNFGDN